MAWAAIDPDGPQLAIGAAKAEHGLCLQIPGMNLKKDGIWRAPLAWPTYVAFRAVWAHQPVSEHPELQAWAGARWEEMLARYEMRAALDASEPLRAGLVAMEDGGDLHLSGIQRAHTEWLMTWRRCVLGDPMGNGKTPPLIRALQLLHAQEQACPALVVCPDSAPRSWARKLAAWAPELRVQVVSGTAAKRRSALEAGADVYVVAWSTLRYHTRLAAYSGQAFVKCDEHGGTAGKSASVCEVHDKELNQIRPRTVIADECHRMKDARGKASRAAQYLAHHAENFWGVTGTLTADDIGDLWPVLHAIDPRGWPAKSRYIDLYAQTGYSWRGGAEILDLRPDTSPYFHTAVDPLIRRIPREVARAGQPPRLEPEFRYPELLPGQKASYRQLVKELLADIGGQQIVPDGDAVKFGRLVQLASSMVSLEDGESEQGFTKQEVRLSLPSNKADDLVQFLADNPGQWVVSCYSPALVELCERKLDPLKITHTKIVGGMSGDQKDAASQFFQNGDMRVIFVTAAGSESIDLYAALGIVFLQPNPSFIAREQLIGRVDRWGQQNPVRQVYMLSPGTVDQRLYDLGTQKEERHTSVTQDPAMLRWMLENAEPAGAW